VSTPGSGPDGSDLLRLGASSVPVDGLDDQQQFGRGNKKPPEAAATLQGARGSTGKGALAGAVLRLKSPTLNFAAKVMLYLAARRRGLASAFHEGGVAVVWRL
jgi:hypothetical protein